MHFFDDITVRILANEKFLGGVKALLILLAGFVTAKAVTLSFLKIARKRFNTHHLQIFQRSIFYGIFSLFAITALHQLGFDLGVLLGAAGLFSVALGFASQTSASNLISGLFLLGEQPFVVGDVIKVGNTLGEVLSVDLLSVKLRTFENLYVRIPNETIIKSEVTTLTRFPIRRFDLQLGVAYKENLERVRDILLQVAEANPLCLQEPKPLFIFLGFGDSSLNIQLSIWAAKENYLDLRNSMFLEIKAAFDREKIEIPFPHRTLYTGAETEPFPVRVVVPEGQETGQAIDPERPPSGGGTNNDA